MLQILVTGGCGYIGSHIVKLLSEQSERVLVFDNLSHGTQSALLHKEELIIGDIRDQGALHRLFMSHDISAVIHLAALVNAKASLKKPKEYQQVNDLGSRNVWAAATAAGVKYLLYASSAAVYGTPKSHAPLKESAPLNPESPYGITKLAGEQSLMRLANGQASYVAFRFFNVGGAESNGRLGQSKTSRSIMQRLFAASDGQVKSLTISGHDYETQDGTVVRDFIHVEDIAKAFVLALDYLRHGQSSQVLNLGSGQPHTIGKVIKEVMLVTGKNISLKYGPRIKGDISYSLADIHLAQKILGWKPSHNLHQIVQDGWNAYVNKK